jgi:D-3-phosphoglycerate dehydrogenase
VARERGLAVSEHRTDEADRFASLVTLELGSGAERVMLSGASAHGRPHLAGLDGFAIEAVLAGTILVTRHRDQPGIVGAVGSALASAGINISSLELSRLSAAGEAMMFVSVDHPISSAVLDGLRAVPGMLHAQVVELPA